MKAFGAALLFLCSVAGAAGEPASAARFRLLGEALAQADRVSGGWDPSQRDCAGFVRYLFRKSIPSSSPLWIDRNQAKTPFLTAGDLLAYNFQVVDRVPSRERTETGDLLAYFLPHKPPEEAWHLMVLLRPPGMATDRTLVIYHNGAEGKAGEVRKVWLDDLIEGPPEWRPVAGNARYVGVFRWRGWGDSSSRGR